MESEGFVVWDEMRFYRFHFWGHTILPLMDYGLHSEKRSHTIDRICSTGNPWRFLPSWMYMCFSTSIELYNQAYHEQKIYHGMGMLLWGMLPWPSDLQLHEVPTSNWSHGSEKKGRHGQVDGLDECWWIDEPIFCIYIVLNKIDLYRFWKIYNGILTISKLVQELFHQ